MDQEVTISATGARGGYGRRPAAQGRSRLVFRRRRNGPAAPTRPASLRDRAGAVAAAGPCTQWCRDCRETVHAVAPMLSPGRTRWVRYMRCRAAAMAALLSSAVILRGRDPTRARKD